MGGGKEPLDRGLVAEIPRAHPCPSPQPADLGGHLLGFGLPAPAGEGDIGARPGQQQGRGPADAS